MCNRNNSHREERELQLFSCVQRDYAQLQKQLEADITRGITAIWAWLQMQALGAAGEATTETSEKPRDTTAKVHMLDLWDN